MKIQPRHDLKRPLYALGAAVLAASLLTGCPADKDADRDDGTDADAGTSTVMSVERLELEGVV